ncbi:hypothetical protein COB55_01805 [Candidatus Wolfebacteria bacterium]|nr:MAG: hypothetical protein COB55_01805 [Candidatus Wolfebacteria bacterium]
MPHVSKSKLTAKTKRDLEKHLLQIIRDTDSKARVQIFDELLTPTEKIMLAKRIGMIFLIKKGVSLYKISDLLGVSASTANRFLRDVHLKKYQRTSKWVFKYTKEGSHNEFVKSLLSLMFTGRTHSFKQFVDKL